MDDDIAAIPLKILIVEDNVSLRLVLKISLSQDHRFQVVGEAQNGVDAIQMTDELRPDIIIMDIEMPLMDGISATRHIKEKFPLIKVIMLTSSTCKEHVYASLTAGADGYCLKNIEMTRLLEVVTAVAQNEIWIDPAFGRIILELLPEQG